ncbi:MAG: YceI family protein [Chromatiaceae bacterium]
MPEQPPGFPTAFYRAAATSGRTVYRIESQDSLATVNAYRGGSLANLGHDHVISSRRVQGYVLASDVASEARADIYVSLADLKIDEPPLRQAAGLEGQLKPPEIAATRRHMLEDVLQAARYPFLEVHAGWASDAPPHTVLQARISLHGVTRSYRVPVSYSRDAETVTVTGQLRIRQTEFGMTPYSVLGGSLKVKDELGLRFSLEAKRMGSA